MYILSLFDQQRKQLLLKIQKFNLLNSLLAVFHRQNVHKFTIYICTTAAIQIKGTAQWLYWVDLEYQQSQQIVVVTPG